MDLKGLLPTKESKEKSELFWSVIIEPKWVQASIWRIVDEKVDVVSKSQPSAWELEEELISAADTALTSAVQELDDDEKEPEKTVFGVLSAWVEEGQIKKEHLGKIKKLCSELSLKPAGFVVLSEAIANMTKAEEGTPLSAIVLGLSKENVEVSLFKLGIVVGTTSVARSISITEDVVEGLSRFAEAEALPSRFILFNSKESELEEVRQHLMQANWDDFEKLSFLHTPKIELVNAEKKLDAVSLAGAVDIANVNSLASAGTPQNEEEELPVPKDAENVQEVDPEELGFAINSDISGSDQTPSDEDMVAAAASAPPTHAMPQAEVPPPMPPQEKVNVKERLGGIFAPLLSKFKRSPKASQEHHDRSFSSGKKALVFGGIFFLLLLVGGFSWWWFYPKATVTVYLSTTNLEERVTMKVDPDANAFRVEDGVLPGQVLTTQISGSKSRGTTGVKTVGDPATGEVTLFRVGSEVTLDSNATLTGPGGLEFTLDEGVTIASGSASTPGTATVAVTASDIGADYNLASNTAFEVSNYSLSDIEAKNDSAFSGGTSREISAVSEDDQDGVQEDLEKELKAQALEELTTSLKSSSECTGCVLVEESYTTDNEEVDFSDKVGDEASNIEVTIDQDVQILAVAESDLVAFSEELLKDRIPDGFVLRGDQVDVEFEFEEEQDGMFVLNAFIKVNLLPEVSPETIAEKIAGKYPQLIEEFLTSEIPGFVRAEVRLMPRLPGRLGTLPHVKENIEIEMAAER